MRKKVERLWSKRKLVDAIGLQRQICQSDAKNADEWQRLAELASAAGVTELELAARFEASKLQRVGPDEWVALADRAMAAGFVRDAMDARFRAADACATLGQSRRAIMLFDQVLALDPDHQAARRIRQVVQARLARAEAQNDGAARRPNTARSGSSPSLDGASSSPGSSSTPASSRPGSSSTPASSYTPTPTPDRASPASSTPAPVATTMDELADEVRRAEEETRVLDGPPPLPPTAEPASAAEPASPDAAAVASAAEPESRDQPMTPSSPTKEPSEEGVDPSDDHVDEREDEREDAREDERGDDLDWEETTFTRLGHGAPSSGVSALEAELDETDALQSLDEDTNTQWAPANPDLGSEGAPTVARFVCETQPWPTVLDQHCLLFVGMNDVVPESLLELAEPVSLAEGALVYRQGTPGELLYLLEHGDLRIGRERGRLEDLGTIPAGCFFGEAGSIARMPSTVSIWTTQPCELKVISRERLRPLMGEANDALAAMVQSLRGWYLETVTRISPILEHCRKKEATLADDEGLVSFTPGQSLVVPGAAAKLFVLLSGVAQVAVDGANGLAVLGHLCAGDLVGELSPSPVAVTAVTHTSALVIDRRRLGRLPESLQEALDARYRACEAVLAAHGGAKAPL
ncbi:MAG: cyclic nucleotide-binding domain-containing protein [Deltaproteobacteria bacterium]|nr:cyclic nucleotide-binding domain-containing protein [Deltaproteobacteria bacterium]